MENTHRLPEVHITTARLIETNDLANRVRHTIHTAPATDRFGDRKVYIDRLLEVATEAELLALHRQRKITLVRADHVAAMDPTRVKASRIGGHFSEAHFAIDPTKH